MRFKNECLGFLLLSSFFLPLPAFSGIIDEKAVLGEYDKIVKDAKKEPQLVPSSYPGVVARTVVDRELTKAERVRNNAMNSAMGSMNGGNAIGAIQEPNGSYTLTDQTSIIQQSANQVMNSLMNTGSRDNIIVNGNVYGTLISVFNNKIPGLQ